MTAQISIANARRIEGTNSYNGLTFTVTLSEPAPSGGVSVDYRTVQGTATEGTDYIGLSPRTLTIAAGNTTGTINVNVYGDTIDETDENFYVQLSNPTGAVFSGNSPLLTAIGTILDDDGSGSNLALNVSNPVIVEGDSGTQIVHVEADLSEAPTTTITIPYTTVDGSAKAGQDYAAKSGSITFAPGQTTAGVDITVNGDTTVEPTENFSVVFSPPATVASGANGAASTVTILDDDAAAGALPVISIGDARRIEGNSSYDGLAFTVTLSAPAPSGGVSVEYRTVQGTATDGSDYIGLSPRTLTIAAGDTTGTINVNVYGDTVNETDENFYVQLSNPSGAVLAGNAPLLQAVGTILDDDGLLSNLALNVSNPVIVEGNSGNQVVHIEADLSEASTAAITIPYTTVDGTAKAGSDYVATSGSITFLPGQTTASVDVTVNSDTTVEPTENFSVVFSPPATVASGANGAASTVTILDDDAAAGALPVISIGDARRIEGNSSYDGLAFTVTLSAPAPSGGVSVEYRTVQGTATDGSDYIGLSPRTLTIAAGDTTGTINVNVYGDTTDETDENFYVQLSNPSGAVLAGNAPVLQAAGTILDDDGLGSNLAVTPLNPTMVEGSGGTTPMEFQVSLSEPVSSTVTIPFYTVDGTAAAGKDYTATSGTLTFAPGQTVAGVSVPIIGDYEIEPTETFSLVLGASTSGPATAAVSAIGTIVDDDTGVIVPGTSHNDSFVDGPANQLFDGGAGYDVLYLNEVRRGDTFILQDNADVTMLHGSQVDTLRGIEAVKFIDGRMVFDPNDPAAQIARLYTAALGREPDQDGLNGWTSALQSGTPLTAVAATFAKSAEFTTKYGALDDTGFVTLLYNNVLGRAPDPVGLSSWVGALNAGTPRENVLVGFSESAEHKARTFYQVGSGLWDRSENAAEVGRLYDTVFGRQPDLAGLSGWTNGLDTGAINLQQIADSFVASPEFQAVYGALGNHDFVETLYEHSLHRMGDAAGLSSWVSALDAGTITRGNVVLGFSDSGEHIANTSALITSNNPSQYGIAVSG